MSNEVLARLDTEPRYSLERGININEAKELGSDALELVDVEHSVEIAHRKLASHIDRAENKFGIKNGTAKSAHIIHIGEACLPVIEFSDDQLDEDGLHKVAKAYQVFVDLVGETNAALFDISIAVTDGRFIDSSNSIANSDKETGIIRISRRAFEDDLRTDTGKEDDALLVGDVDPAMIMLIHELAHQVEFVAMRNSSDNDARIIKSFMEDGGILSSNFRNNETDIAGKTVRVLRGDAYVDTNATDEYNGNTIVDRPTRYSAKAHGEYFAEAFTIYALAPDKLSQPLRDLIRATLDQDLYVAKYPQAKQISFIEDVLV